MSIIVKTKTWWGNRLANCKMVRQNLENYKAEFYKCRERIGELEKEIQQLKEKEVE